ncbi:MAG: aminodeoxychorismate synthase component I [Actinobacteria bacterium]|nr:aminodeoxychorismate synthase component I [Actinomycetota bacterium]
MPEEARLFAVAIDSRLDPLEVVRRFGRDPRPFALVGAWAGSGALVGSEPVALLGQHDDPFRALEQVPVVEGGTGPHVGGGWFGYLGYQLNQRLEHLPPAPPRPSALPDHSLAFYDHLLRFDARGDRWWFEALWSPERDGFLRSRLELMTQRLQDESHHPYDYRIGAFEVLESEERHVSSVSRCRDHIYAGDIYQANLCLRLEAPFSGRPEDLFARGAAELRPLFSAFIKDGWGALASFSPELFLRRRGREVHTVPIKGTIKRDPVPAVAERQRRALLDSGKDRAENVMIVDLMRNDLGRVCVPGTVRVPQMLRAEAHPGVWHLVSDVVGELRAGAGDADLMRACFPPGSVTGAPKVRAMGIINELESTGREIYTGAIGFVSPLWGLEFNVAIRTFEIAGGSVWLGAGGGVVADSDPHAEYLECLAKAEPLIRAVSTDP